MKAVFHSGVSGLMAYQQALDTVGNNVANVNTVGYKTQSSNFDDLLYTQMNTKSAPELLRGRGVKVAATQLHAEQGSLIPTGIKLDFAVLGDGFFMVDNAGSQEFTRNGAFAIGIRSRRNYLTTTDGAYVLDLRGRKIELTTDAATGLINYDDLAGRIGVYRFANPHALNPLSSTRYQATEESGAQARDTKGVCEVKSGYLEQSGTKLEDQMTNLITAQRAYQVSARVLQTGDEIEEIVNGLRR
ncbi:MAG: flagellar hook-basal body protein [Peptococcaceae bacterium]|jgi:flagellar basal-body rod protein FlgG|nr:flagellar hook-basal body protein [Peptococcaceae bacterium]